jgi:hypothetical protein
VCRAYSATESVYLIVKASLAAPRFRINYHPHCRVVELLLVVRIPLCEDIYYKNEMALEALC